MAAPTFMTGARAVLKITNINGEVKTIAFATNVSYRISTPHAPVVVMGRYTTATHEPLGQDCSVSCGVVRAPGVTKETAQTATGMGIMAHLRDLMRKQSLTIEVTDRKHGQPILTIQNAHLVDRSGGGSARDLFSESWEFVGTVASDETGPETEAAGAVEPTLEQ